MHASHMPEILLADGREARNAAADDHHLGRRNPPRRRDLSAKQPAKLVCCLHHSPASMWMFFSTAGTKNGTYLLKAECVQKGS